MSTDVCVPISELAGAIQHAKDTLDKVGLVGGILGHVGDGNFHVLLMVDPNDKEEVEKADEINESIVLYALKRGGTCTGNMALVLENGSIRKKNMGRHYS